MSELFDAAEVRRTLATLIDPAAVFEIRVIEAKLPGNYRPGIISGYFDSIDACIAELGRLISAEGVYVTMNPVDPALLARRANRLDYAKSDSTTGDHHILGLLWFLIDVDYDRPKGISTTDEQKELTKKKAREIYRFLQKRGWPKPVAGDSGNGHHLIYWIKLSSAEKELLKAALEALADCFDEGQVKVDRTVYNPSRIIKLYGTLACKGDNTKERPHRLSKILDVPKSLEFVSAEQLQELVDDLLPKEQPAPSNPAPAGPAYATFELEAFLLKHAIAHKEKRVLPDGREMWLLEACPFNPDHNGTEVAVFRWPEGKLGFQCKHSSDVGKGWKDFRQHFEPARKAPRVRLGDSNEQAADDDSTELTSLSSPGAANYPAPIDEVAYYGLAGEIVRRIEPHTEADPAALLFQFLAAFGNLIGHDHYIVADGTRHHLSLYGVLVGQSSKGRKGTSWNHVANVMERVDPEWREDRISFGLSSGEGLIWAVHDPIEETRPIREKGRCTGEYETYIANHGEADKRLFVIESEFANVLKVMTREGNTLSPVIRSAWDCSDLRTMVKNSPAKATGAHISIIGHITRDELRRYLTQTESANGFANRFCWLAVKRSKCLPDGGAIYTVNFEDTVAELQAAISFAKDFVEIARDAEAKKLWHEVYPSLSEAQPGMSGAVIGRAEAQVMRLSAIYALLNKSRLIRPEHHHAASAVWRYCEDSARWIFETGTGNKNADRVLAALKAAGKKGLTKWQITSEVFNRHATKFEIDEALRLLHSLKRARCERESTATRHAERWFYLAQGREECEESAKKDGKTVDTSHTSHPPPSHNASSAESAPVTEEAVDI